LASAGKISVYLASMIAKFGWLRSAGLFVLFDVITLFYVRVRFLRVIPRNMLSATVNTILMPNFRLKLSAHDKQMK
jgi:hypothetical protein